MNVPELIQAVTAQGVELWFEGDRIRFRAPKGALSPEQRTELAARKSEILAHLRAEAAASETTCPLSFSQQALWFLHQQAPHSASYHVAMSVRLLSAIDEGALRSAVQALIDRHAILRTTYASGDSLPVQRIAGFVGATLDVYAAASDDAELRSRVEADYRRPFDLENGPIFRASLYTRDTADHVLLLTVHHIAADGWSLLMLFEELFKFYSEFAGGPPASVPRPKLQFSDYVKWQTELLGGHEHDRMWSYWRDKLAPPRTILDLPADRLRSPVQTFRGDSFAFELTAEETQRLTDFARSEGVTLFVALLATFQAMLHRLTGADDVTVGTPVFARSKAEFMTVVGDFVNPLPIRGRLSEDTTFRQLLLQLKQTVHEALNAQEFPLSLLVQRLQPTRDAGRSPLFDTFFLFQRFDQFRHIESLLAGSDSEGAVELGGLQLAPYLMAQQEGQFDLAFQTLERRGVLHCVLKYSTDLFDASTIERMSAQYRVLVRSVLDAPDARLNTISILPPEERDWLVREVNATTAAYPQETISRLFEREAARHPGRIALQHDGATFTYGELNSRANQLAHHLRRIGVKPGNLVGTCLNRSPELVVTLLGVLKAGAAYVPLDPGFPPERLAYMLADSDARVVVTAHGAAAVLDSSPDVRVIGLANDAARLSRESEANLVDVADSEQPAYVIYTSGSTGRPKGVVVPHGALVNFLWSMKRQPGLLETDVLAAVTTISFDIASLELFLPLLVGARIQLISRDVAADGEGLSAQLASCGATVLQATPATWRMLIEAGWRGAPGFRALCGGEALGRDLANDILERVSELWNLYGPTETTVWSTAERVERGSDPITIGRPIDNTRIYVLDSAGQFVPIGVPGEIWIGGVGVACGYHNRPELTSERFVPDPFSSVPDARMYRTGDVGRWGADRRLHHLGRRDHQVKVRGFRIELGEIEAVLARHPAVRECVVVVRERVAGDARMVAYVVANASAPSVIELRAHLATQVPDYMVPAAFVFLDRMPKTNNGKIDRNALPASEDIAATDEFTTPATETESEVALVFADVLRLPKVGVHQSFFELGGHSLLATRALARLRKRFEIDVPLSALFQSPTVQSLSEWLDRAMERKASAAQVAPADVPPQWSCLVPSNSTGSHPPLFLITGYMDVDDTLRILSNLIPHLGPDQPLCGIRPRWLDGRSPQYTSVSEMTRHFLNELRAFRPHGPYYLVGDCVGGVVAIELAESLLEQGEEVAMLVLIDTERPRFYSPVLIEMGRLWERAHHMREVFQQLMRPDSGRSRWEIAWEVLHRKLRRARLTTSAITRDDHIYEQRVTYQRQLKRHRLKRYSGRLSLILSDDVYRFKWLLGWKGFIDGGIDVYRIPGDHRTFRAEFSKELSERLQECIERADAARQGRVPRGATGAAFDDPVMPAREEQDGTISAVRRRSPSGFLRSVLWWIASCASGQFF